MDEPVFFEPMIQKEAGDCGISCLAMLLGKSYQEVIAAAPANAHKKGLSMRGIRDTALKLGTPLRLRRKLDLKEDIGILGLLPDPTHNNGRIKRDEHVALLIEGHIYDTYVGRLWLDVDTYLQVERYRLGSLLTRED